VCSLMKKISKEQNLKKVWTKKEKKKIVKEKRR
jgi:hypothetical protein